MRTYPSAPSNYTGHFVMQVPVISTCHLRREDFEKLSAEEEPCFPCLFRERKGSLILHLGDMDMFSIYSKDFLKLVRYFKGRGWAYLRFDGEIGEVVEDLPQFDW